MIRSICLVLLLAGCEGSNVDLSTQSFDGFVAGADLARNGNGNGDGGIGAGGDGGEPLPPAAGPESGPYADFVTARAHAYCTWLSRCGVVAAADEAGCESAESASVTSAPPPYSPDDAVAASRATVDATAAKACTDALAAAGCSARDVDAARSACASVVVGKVQIGLGCRADFECAGGWCGNIALGCGAVCRPFATAGFDCSASLCDPSSFCDQASHKCVANGASGAECEARRPCASGLVCHGLIGSQLGSTGTCAAVAKAGEACVTSDDCALGLYCASATARCTARVADGAQCTDSDACENGKTCVGLAYPQGTSVGKPGTCAAFLDVGAACDPTADDSGCPNDTTCGKTSKTCDAVGDVGMPCPATGCRDGLYCDDKSTCQPLIGYGAACAPDAATARSACRWGACDENARACLTYCP